MLKNEKRLGALFLNVVLLKDEKLDEVSMAGSLYYPIRRTDEQPLS